MATVSIEDLGTSYERRRVLDGVSLTIPDGGFAAVLGPSGAGKSTLLRSIAGFVTLDSGRIVVDGHDITSLPTSQRDVGMVAQTSALLPSRNVRRNVALPLEIRREAAASIRERVGAEARAMQIEHLLERDPSQLSRGEQQLVQIARTMVRVPRILLLDEPFAPLDEHLRQRMRNEIRTLQRGYGVTTLMATNDPVDAMSLASLLVVLGGSPASIVQVGSPHDVHDEPASIDVATATGSLWQVPVSVEPDAGGYRLSCAGALRLKMWSPALAGHVGSGVTLGVRTSGLARHERGHAEAELVKIVPGAAGGLLCRWAGRLVSAVGEATSDEIGTTIRLNVDRPQLFHPGDGSRIV